MSDRLDLIVDLAKRAGKIALEMRDSINPRLKADGSFVTEADEAVQEFLFENLSREFPRAVLIGEEDCCENGIYDPDRPVFVIDPIDGTDVYRTGLAYFCMSIGLFENGRFTLGVIHLPVFDDTYAVDEGRAPMMNDRPLAVCAEQTLTENSFLAAPSTFHKTFITEYPGKIRSLGSTAFHLALVAAGGAAGAIPMAFVWDVAAGIALAEAAGAKVGLFNGEPIDFSEYLDGRSLPEDLLVAPEPLFDQIAAAVSFKH